MLVRIRQLRDKIRSSLFWVPLLFVIGAVVLAELMLQVDQNIGVIPSRLSATVDSARSVLAVVASATFAFAGIAFSVSLLLISLASSQYSPRVVHGLFRDPFNKRVMGVVIGTFVYCLLVLTAVQLPVGEGVSAPVPSLSIFLAVVLGVASVLSIVAFIDHSAHLMDVSKILHRVTADALSKIRDTWLDAPPEKPEDDLGRPDGAGFAVTFGRQGWVQQVDYDALLGTLEPGSAMELETVAGRYAIPNTALCSIWPPPSDKDKTKDAVRSAVLVDETRTMQQDVTYGVRQLADVALKALSPGINDPTTAQDALFHLGAVVRELLVRTPPARHMTGRDGRVLLLPQALTHEELVGLAFDEVRLAAVGQPTVQIYILEILELLSSSLEADHRTDALAALRVQADLVLESSRLGELPAYDVQRVRTAHRIRFPEPG